MKFPRYETKIPNDAMTPCRENDPELWWSNEPGEVEDAKQLCHRCPFEDVCRSEALSRRERDGVWGGVFLKGGEIQDAPRPTGRPPKQRVA